MKPQEPTKSSMLAEKSSIANCVGKISLPEMTLKSVGHEGLQKHQVTRVVPSRTNQRIGFFSALNPACTASGDRQHPHHQTTRTTPPMD
jgi:hypothetical protein